MTDPLLVIDVAHPPRRPDVVEAELLGAWGKVRNSDLLRVLKVVHGYGSSGTGGNTRIVVRNWAFANRRLFRNVIPGEEYLLLSPATQELRKEVGNYPDEDLTMPNPGITLIWVR